MNSKKKFTVVGYDSFSREEFPVGQYETKDEAMSVAKSKGGTMTLMYVYDENMQRIGKYGTF